MASSSSSSVMASPAADASSFDIFISFRGEDVRDSFVDHLYKALKGAGFLTFRDEEEINKGEPLKPEIVRAIEGSKASIVVLSKNYATSTWCLDELLLILEQRREFGHFVLPVFYHVDPCDVRNQTNTFKFEVKSSSRWTDQNVNLWKKALAEVADLSGEVAKGHETDLLKNIVDIMYNKLDHRKLHLPDNLVGMATRYEHINSFLNEPNVNILAICGMGGSGKTTLAKYIYNSNWNSFENLSYLEEIGSRCKGYDELLQQQEQLLHDIIGGKNRPIPSVSEATFNIKEAVKRKRAFIVLDDIANLEQIDILLGNGEINPKSKIIITTTVLDIEDWFNFGSRRCRKYEMRLFNDDESLELLCRHAFRSKFPKEGFKELAVKAVHYCEGNPLALKVLGSSLSLDNSIQAWGSTLSSFEKSIHNNIRGVLIGSYNSLPQDFHKKLFLHIACFFVGKDKEYVEKILEHDYFAFSGIKYLCSRCLLSVSPKNKLMMHRLLQDLGKDIADKESEVLTERSRVWNSRDSYKILRKGKGSERVEGLALDMEMLRKEEFAVNPSKLKTDALNNMDKLKLLQLNSVQLTGSYDNISEDLRWLCWFGFHLETIPFELFMGNLVAIDMSCSKLEVFEPPMELKHLRILNLKDSDNLLTIQNMSKIPHLEILILWNCHNLVHLCETIMDLKALVLLNMTGCEKLFKEQAKLLAGQEDSTSGGGAAEQPTFFFPHSLHRLFLKGCYIGHTDSFPLTFRAQPSLQYLNLGHGLFEFLPDYSHLENLRVLDLSFCSRLRSIKCLPSTLAELYVYYCTLLERITFESHRFTLQEFGYKGCISLSEVEDLFKLVPVAKLEENDLGHLKWLKEYQDHEVCLVGDVELTEGRSSCIQMLYEFDIMSTSLPYIKDPNIKPEYVSELSPLYFKVPPDLKNRRLKGLDVTFKYTISGDNSAFFCKISMTNGIDLMYNPKVFGKPDSGKVGIWLSYWPIGNTLNTGDQVSVSIVVMSGLEVHECGVTLVYANDKAAEETLGNNRGWEEILGGDLSGFQLSTGAYYLCRRDFFELMELGILTLDWFRILVGDTIDLIEVRGWRKTGRPKQLYRSFTELKTARCIIHGPETEEIYKIAEMSKYSGVDKTSEFKSSRLAESMESGTSYISRDTPMQVKDEKLDADTDLNKFFGDIYKDADDDTRRAMRKSFVESNSMDMSKAFFLDEIEKSASSPQVEKLKSPPTHYARHQSKPSLSLPWKIRILLSLLSTVTNASLRKDGTVNRRLLKLLDFRSPPTSKSIDGVASHDVVVDQVRHLWFRVFVPTEHAGEDLPVIVYFHGGGFIFHSPDVVAFDAVGRRFAREVPAVVVSVNYRLAPEHRYPAQHDDCFDVLKFLDDDENSPKSMPENANLVRCFLVGDSAGGNLAHHVAQRACEFNFRRLKVIGVAAIQPFFGGEERTESEIRLVGTPILSLKRTDWFWKAFLPEWEGFSRDHPIINVTGPNAVDISKIDFPATMVVVGGFDILHDWQKRYYEWLKKSGKEVYLFEYPNMCHAFYIFPELPESTQLFGQVKDFVQKVSSNVPSSITDENLG